MDKIMKECLRPITELNLSVIVPIIGSVTASAIIDMAKAIPQREGGTPNI